jgi:hypothetical protein
MAREVKVTVKAVSVGLATVLFVLGLAPALAQSSGGIEVKIPFQFTVSGRAMRPAVYLIDIAGTTGPGVLRIRAKDGSLNITFDTVQLAKKSNPKGVALIFEKIGGKDYLMEVWGVENSGRGVKHFIDGELLKRAPEGSSGRITTLRIIPKD